jgi:hypothetical protein
VVCLRGEDDGLADQLALGVLGDGNGVAAGAGSATDEGALGRRGPAAMADVGKLDLAVVGVGGLASKHAEAFLECCGLAAWDVVDIETAVVDKLPLGSSVSDLRDAAILSVSRCSENEP